MILSARYGAVAASLPKGGPDAYTLIDSVSLTGNVSSITFTSIDQDFAHLLLEGVLYGQNTYHSPNLTMNGNTTQYRSARVAQELSVNPAKRNAVGLASNIPFTFSYSWYPNVVAGCRMTFLDYKNTARYKNVLYQIGGYTTDNYTNHSHGWGTLDNTAAITSFTITGSFTTGTKLNLFGVAGAV
jgi:hypothetical protein